MSREIIPFDFEQSAVRVVMIDGAPWFVAADVCRVLGHSNSRMALKRLDADEKAALNLNTVTLAYTIQPDDDRVSMAVDTPRAGRRGNPNVAIVSESGLNALIMTGETAQARCFRRWVTGEVIPALLRRGSYALPGAAAQPATDGLRLGPADRALAFRLLAGVGGGEARAAGLAWPLPFSTARQPPPT